MAESSSKSHTNGDLKDVFIEMLIGGFSEAPVWWIDSLNIISFDLLRKMAHSSMFLPESNDDLATILYKIVCAQKIVDDPVDLDQKVQAQHTIMVNRRCIPPNHEAVHCKREIITRNAYRKNLKHRKSEDQDLKNAIEHYLNVIPDECYAYDGIVYAKIASYA